LRQGKLPLQGIAYFSRWHETVWMEPTVECLEEAQGLWLVRTFLALPPDKRRRVLQFVEELSRDQGRPREANEASPP
jgi:hypothetical protein